MKKTILWGALFTLLCSQTQAEVTQQDNQPAAQNPTVSTPNTTTPTNTAAPTNMAPSAAQPTQAPASNPQPTVNQPATSAQPAAQTPTQEVPPVPAQPAPVINCDYKIPAETKTIDQSLITTWAQNAMVQIFEFNPNTVDSQVQKLQACFTEPGWTGFNAALQKSGNIEAIKSQKLTVSSQVDGTAQVTEAKDNQWKITLPLQVVYQNDKEKVTQLLDIKLTIGRKVSGDLGIMQMIAAPRPTANPQPAATTAPAENAPASSSNESTPETPAPTVTPGNSAAPDAANQPAAQSPAGTQQ